MMAYDNPVLTAIQSYKAVDDIYRQKRRDKQDAEDREYTRALQARALERQEEADTWQREERDYVRESRAREKRLRALNSAYARIQAGEPPTESDRTLALEGINDFLDASGQLHNDVPAALKGDREATARVLDHMARVDANRFTLQGTRYGRPVALYPAPGKPGAFVVEGEFADYARDAEGNVILDDNGDPMVDDKTRRRAPLTKGKSSDPNDEVNVYTISDVMPKILEKAKVLEQIRTQLIAEGDKGAAQDQRRERIASAIDPSRFGDSFTQQEVGAYKSMVEAGADPEKSIEFLKAIRPAKKAAPIKVEEGTGTPGGRREVLLDPETMEPTWKGAAITPKPDRAATAGSDSDRRAARKEVDAAAKRYLAARQAANKGTPEAALARNSTGLPPSPEQTGAAREQYAILREEANAARRDYEQIMQDYRDEWGEVYTGGGASKTRQTRRASSKNDPLGIR